MNILWDFDGTLFNTYPAYTKILKSVLPDAVSNEEIYAQLKVSFSHAFAHFDLNEEEERFVRAEARKLKPGDLFPFPGVVDVLKSVNKNVIMTHKERDDIVNILKHHLMDGYFVDMVAGDDGFPRKPDKASYEFLHQKHQIHLAVGDRELDILPAKELGMKTCLFQNQTAGADFYVQDYKKFFKIVDFKE